jgi:hypothetical protein
MASVQTNWSVSSSNNRTSRPLSFGFNFVLPQKAAGDNSSLVKCSELADLSWSVFTPKLCKFTMSTPIVLGAALQIEFRITVLSLEANSYFMNPAEVTVTVNSLAYDMSALFSLLDAEDFTDEMLLGCSTILWAMVALEVIVFMTQSLISPLEKSKSQEP